MKKGDLTKISIKMPGNNDMYINIIEVEGGFKINDNINDNIKDNIKNNIVNLGFNDYVKFFDSDEKVVVFHKSMKFDCFFGGNWDGYSIFFGDFVNFIGLVNQNIKFIKTGVGCAGNIGSNCIVELGESNNISAVNNNYIKFKGGTILDVIDNNVIIGEYLEKVVYTCPITANDFNNIILNHKISNITVNNSNIINTNINSKDSKIIAKGSGNSTTFDGNINFIQDGHDNIQINKDKKELINIKSFFELISSKGSEISSNYEKNIDRNIDKNKTKELSIVENKEYYFDDKTINKIKKSLKSNIFGQDEIVKKVEDFLDGINIKTKKGPAGVFFQIGKTGVGKNYLWETIGEASGLPVKVIDASTFHESEGSSLLGTTQGYVGSGEPSILETIYDESYDFGGRSIIIIDELDKITVGKSGNKQESMISFIQTLMNMFENDRVMLKNSGKEIDISRFIFIINTNLFVDERVDLNKKINKIGFNTGEIELTVEKSEKDIIIERLKNFLPLSIYNRVASNLLTYNDLKEEIINDLINKEWQVLTKAIKNYYGDVKLPLLKKYKDNVMNNYDKELGMRGIKNYIHDHIKPELIKIVKNNGQNKKKISK